MSNDDLTDRISNLADAFETLHVKCNGERSINIQYKGTIGGDLESISKYTVCCLGCNTEEDLLKKL